MNWKAHAIEDLNNYNYMKLGIINSQELLAIINAGKTPVLSNDKKYGVQSFTEPASCRIQANKLRRNIASAQRITRLIERALNSLTTEERIILCKFYIDNNPKPASILSSELGFSLRSLYRARDAALKKFTIAMYGTAAS